MDLQSIFEAARYNTDTSKVPTEVVEAFEDINKDELEIVFWDFAGQDIYYTTHQVCSKVITLFTYA